MNLTKIIEGLEKGVQFAESIVPTIAELTPYGALATTITKAVGAITETVVNVNQRIAEGSIVASSTDAATIRGYAQRLHDLNDTLAQQIDDS